METAFFFGLPFGIAGMVEGFRLVGYCIDTIHSLADEEEQIGEGLMLAKLDGIGGSTGGKYLYVKNVTLDYYSELRRGLRVL